MSLILEKGEKLSFSKVAPGVQKFTVGLGWNPNEQGGESYDLDASVFMLKADKMRTEEDLVFYAKMCLMPNGQRKRQDSGDPFWSDCGSIRHTGDNLTGKGEGDDETIEFDLSKVPAEIDNLVIVVTIYTNKENESKQNFGQVDKSYIRIYNTDTKVEIARYDLSEDFSSATGVTFGRIYRKDGEWKFEATGKGEKLRIGGYLKKYS